MGHKYFDSAVDRRYRRSAADTVPAVLRDSDAGVAAAATLSAGCAANYLFFAGACVRDLHGFLFLAAMGLVPLERHVIFVW